MFFAGCSTFFKTKRQNGLIIKNQFIPGDNCSNGIKKYNDVPRPSNPPAQCRGNES